MRINELSTADAERLVQTALEGGVNFFDHADIYGGGTCEEFFAEAIHMNSTVREKIILQSKCGIRKGMFDFSKEHILEAVDGSLKRLKTDYLDVLLLHRRMLWLSQRRLLRHLISFTAVGKYVILAYPMRILCRYSCLKNLYTNRL